MAKALRDYLPNFLEVATGFVLFPRERDDDVDPRFFDELNQASFVPSKQCDLLIFDSNIAPVIFRDEDFVIVRPESVKSVIEVKGSLTPRALNDSLISALDFGMKWRNTQLFYRKHHQQQSNRPSLFVMAWEVKKDRNGYSSISAKKAREIISKFYEKNLSPENADGFPMLEKLLVYDDFIAHSSGYMPEKTDNGNNFSFAQGWATEQGRFLRRNSKTDSFDWRGDKTISTLLAALQYSANPNEFNRFFSYADEVKHVQGLNCKKSGFSATWVDLPTSKFRKINSDKLIDHDES